MYTKYFTVEKQVSGALINVLGSLTFEAWQLSAVMYVCVWYVYRCRIAWKRFRNDKLFSKYFDLRVQMHDSSLRGGNVSVTDGPVLNRRVLL